MSNSERANEADSYKSPPQLQTAIGISLVAVLIVVMVGFVFLPDLSTVHQSFWSGLIGSFVGGVVAFVLAAFLWRIERRVLVEERVQDRMEARVEEQKSRDHRALLDFLAALGNLRALNYHMVNENQYATARDEYLMDLKIRQAVSLISDDQLRAEAEFISRLLDADSALDYMVSPRIQRFYIANDWLVHLISLESTASPSTARPANYEKLRAGFEDYDEVKQEEWEAIDAWEEEQRQKVAEPSASDAEQGSGG